MEDIDKTCDCNEIKTLLNEILDILANMKDTGAPRKKRKPSKYNQFIGVCMKEGKGMKECAKEYKAKKNV